MCVIFMPNLGRIHIRFGHSFFKVHPFGTSKNAHFGQICPKCTFLAFWRYTAPTPLKTTFSFFAHFYTSNFALFCQKISFFTSKNALFSTGISKTPKITTRILHTTHNITHSTSNNLLDSRILHFHLNTL